MKSAIFYGGKSVEHEISIITALQVYQSLKGANKDTLLVYLSKENKLYVGDVLEDINTYVDFGPTNKKLQEIYIENSDEPTIRFKKKKRKKIFFDVALLLVHGAGVEDGTLSALFELNNIPYYGPSISSGVICQDKVLSKILMKNIEIPVLPYQKLNSKEDITMSYPLIIKPIHLGSSIGINVVKSLEEVNELLPSLKIYDDVFVEPYLDKIREFNIAILGDEDSLRFSQIEEVHGSSEILSYQDKYLAGGSMVSQKRTIPAVINTNLENKIKRYAEKCFKELGCFGVVRFDFIYDKSNRKLYLNELNSVPGSLSFYLFDDFSIVELVDKLIELALKRCKKQNDKLRVIDNQKVLMGFTHNKLQK